MRVSTAVLIPIAMLVGTAGWGAAPSPVADAVMRGDRAALRVLLEQKADVNAPQADGATALQWAAYRDDLETAERLIAAGANVRAANREGVTPLALACINGSAPLIGRLLQAGVDPNQRGPNGETPLMFAARNGRVKRYPGPAGSQGGRECEGNNSRHDGADVGGGAGACGSGPAPDRAWRGLERRF